MLNFLRFKLKKIFFLNYFIVIAKFALGLGLEKEAHFIKKI